MTEKRPDIPRELQRAVLIEAGHRCAIPTCRQPGTELHHIIPWATVREHSFDNLIALCPNDHARAGRNEIDRTALRVYKRNLAILTSRYGDAERRLLNLFAEQASRTITFQQDRTFDFFYLLQDGLLAQSDFDRTGMVGNWVAGIWHYELTPEGIEFLDQWITGSPVE